MQRLSSNSAKCLLATLALAWLGGVVLRAEEPQPAEGPPQVDFVKQIQPIFHKHCYLCHGQEVQEDGFRLDIKRHALAGSDNGKVIVPGDANASRLVELISGTGEDGRFMPPSDEARPLSKSEVALIRAWIDSGAVWADGVDPVEEEQTDLWSFAPVRRPAIPSFRRKTWVRNPIDAFILARLEAAGMPPAAPAHPRALIRRTYFDLLGLPPTTDDAERVATAFVKSPEEPNLERLVDRLLASPHYGERWGRHWLDLVRYADSNGYEVDGEKPMAWKYRDYVVRALNKDTPYNRLILEQLAGDELEDANPETVIATGFYRVGPWDAERGASAQPSEVLAERYNELDDMVSTTSQVFLGVTMGCARCHDHKFDPLTSRDYYSIAAIFSPLKRERNGRAELTRIAAPARDLPSKNRADQRVAELKQQIKSLTAPLRSGVLESAEIKLPAEAVVAFKTSAEQRNEDQKKLVQRHAGEFDKEVADALQREKVATRFLSAEAVQQHNSAEEEIADLQNRFNFPQGYFFFEPSSKPPVSHLLVRGNPKQPGEVVEPAVPAAMIAPLGKQQPKFESADEFTSRRRISLARWIAGSDNPLTSRVIVNRVWQYHFGLGLVRTPSDFGRRGAPPTHPELLDWLAHWFVHDADWSLKKLHRLILTSNAYRMSKLHNEAHAQTDPANQLLWRFPYRRLEAEAIRDSMLAVSGRLNRQLYGPSMYPHVSAESRRSGYDPNSVWKEFNEPDASRRTIYAYVKRTLIVPLLDTLDFCDTTRSADRRDITTVAPQALELLNGEFANRQARHFADRLIDEAGHDVDRQIAQGYRLALSRPATSAEQATLKEFWSRERKELLNSKQTSEAEADRQALVQVCRALFNLNEFVYTD
jgi:hypothetical protein